MTKDLVIRYLIMAEGMKKPGSGLIHHSDRGSQYCSTDFVKHLGRFKMQACREITEYIEILYNRQRRQARLGYLSPVVYG
jgi:putative transposase